ncbi:MAG: YabP/YqfC family sporulation protein [Clostridia bacterium]|nr:YabP/YqfC family sporulation protein [Clostridia bacterium]
MKENRFSAKGEQIIEALTKSMDIPSDALSGFAHIELCGNREARVDGCRGVLEYCSCKISLNTGRLTVSFCGCDLCIASMQNGMAIIKGLISDISFEN